MHQKSGTKNQPNREECKQPEQEEQQQRQLIMGHQHERGDAARPPHLEPVSKPRRDDNLWERRKLLSAWSQTIRGNRGHRLRDF